MKTLVIDDMKTEDIIGVLIERIDLTGLELPRDRIKSDLFMNLMYALENISWWNGIHDIKEQL